jgi:hypothetical protein
MIVDSKLAKINGVETSMIDAPIIQFKMLHKFRLFSYTSSQNTFIPVLLLHVYPTLLDRQDMKHNECSRINIKCTLNIVTQHNT